ncbi:MAG: NADPH-dependent 2,4-dienoyl-CoA reductase, partial [Myxococcales bacterium]|nr:NADPH-dependent 2,4-dienoyl-CoA reductase [Myxococcales bacterium]
GFDVAEYLLHGTGHDAREDPERARDRFFADWGIDTTLARRGGLQPPRREPPAREITLCQRSAGKLGAGLGKTTGWIHRTALKRQGVVMLPECRYERIDDRGLHLTVGGAPQVLEVDNVILCAGQVPRRELHEPLRARGVEVHLIGGADVAAELDAKRAIAQGARVASEI